MKRGRPLTERNESFRTERLGDVLQVFIAEQLRQLHEPMVQEVTITGVTVSPDLKHATVFWTTRRGPEAAQPAVAEQSSSTTTTEVKENLGPSSQQVDKIGEALVRITNLLKRRIGGELELRYTPQLHFRYDSSVEYGSRIDSLLRKAGL